MTNLRSRPLDLGAPEVIKVTPPGSPSRGARWTLACVLVCLSAFVAHTYWDVYTPRYGWTKLILFGLQFNSVSLPRVQAIPRYEDPQPRGRAGYDGQFYAQMAVDPSLRDPAFDRALDTPVYRGRRIGLPAVAFALGSGNPARILQAYALSNLLFWFVLLGALVVLFRPWTPQQLLGLSAGLLSYGAINSMQRSLVDLPAAALIFLGMALGTWRGAACFAMAVLTRETSALAVVGCTHLRRVWLETEWQAVLGKLALSLGPLALWMLYVHWRFPAGTGTGAGNFSWPFEAMFHAGSNVIRHWADARDSATIGDNRAGWLKESRATQQVLAFLALLAQAVYFLVRRDINSRYWRTGICYLMLWLVLGPAVWTDLSQVARVLLPMTLCFYMLLAKERAGWFWLFFVAGSLSIPFGLHKFWLLR